MSEVAAATLPGCLLAQARRRPNAVALRHKERGIWREITWAAYRDRVAAVAREFADLGVGPGDHVAILSENRPEWLYVDLAAQALGARSVGIYQTNPPADVAYVLSHSGSVLLVAEDQEAVDKAVEVAEQTPSVRQVAVIDPAGTRAYTDRRLLQWDDLLKSGQRKVAAEPGGADGWLAARVAELDPHAPAMLVYTSGTTGQPKGAMLTADNALASARRMVPLLGISQSDQLLSYLPLCHVAEKIFSLFVPLSTGAVVHFGESIATVTSDLREVSPTVFLGVPRIWEKMHSGVLLRMADSSPLKRALFQRFVAHGMAIADRRREGRETVLDRIVWRVGDLLVFRPLQEQLGLRRCHLPVTGAAPISADILRFFWGIGVPILEGYGMTECAGVSHVVPRQGARLGTVGCALPETECQIAEDGEVLVRGPHVFAGYHRDEAATRATVDERGWLHTGDVGQVQDGYLTITGRKKEILITAGGKNLSPEKIENALKTSPYIKEAVAVGDGRRFVSALVQIDGDAVGDWATRRGIAYTDFADLSHRPEVRKLVDGEVHAANERLAHVEQVRAICLLPRELNQDDGELTATQKVRRGAVTERWADLIEGIYA